MVECTRPVLRWHGGKWMLAPWILSHFPSHQVYVEPFGGAGSVLMRKSRSYAEVWNDLDDQVVNLFRVLRSDKAYRLVDLLRLTPFSRDEFLQAYEMTDCPLEKARRMIIRSFMGFGSNGVHQPTGFRANSNRSGTTPAHDWVNYPDALRFVIDRLQGVTVENRDAKDVMAQHDAPTTLHYVDPPYVFQTRTDDKADNALSDWTRVERDALADGARKRIEVLWMNPACAQAIKTQSDNVEIPLFAFAKRDRASSPSAGSRSNGEVQE